MAVFVRLLRLMYLLPLLPFVLACFDPASVHRMYGYMFSVRAACISGFAQLSQGLPVFQGLHNYRRGCLYFKACTLLSQHSSADLIAFFSWILFGYIVQRMRNTQFVCQHTQNFIAPWFASQSYAVASYTRQVPIDSTIHVYSKGG